MEHILQMAEAIEREHVSPLEHLSYLADGSWALWRNVVVRGTGFPISHVLRLASPPCTCAAEQLLQAEHEWQIISEVLVKRIRIQQDQSPEKNIAQLLVQVRKAIKSQNIQLIQALPLIEKDELSSKLIEIQEKRAYFEKAYEEEQQQTSNIIHEIAASERFREAILWQNRAAMHASIAALLRHGSTVRGSEQRRRELLVANYLQRYCTKNESIGFFGPLGWASINAEGEALRIQPGKDLLEKRSVYFENWAIDALAEAFIKNRKLLPYCTPRLLPHLSLNGCTLSVPFANPVQLTQKHAAILSLCDGARTAKDIARILLENSENDFGNTMGVYSEIAQLCAAKRIVWTLEVPAEGDPRSHPELRLQVLLERIEDDDLREEYLSKLKKLMEARDAVAQAAGNATLLDEAFDHLERTFVELTNRDSTRSAGHMYAGRTIVYEDCRRDAKVSLGPDFVHMVEEPLTLLLQSARWFTYEVAQSYREAFLQAFEELSIQQGINTINFADFWLWAQPLLFDDTSQRPIDKVIDAFQERWMNILALQPDQRHTHFSSQELLPHVQKAFAAPGPGWKGACYHSPDILVQAASQEDICNGHYQFVLGELHIAMNTQQHLAFLEQYPCPVELINFAIYDIPEPRIVPIFSKNNYPMTRMRPALIAPKDFRLLYSADVVAQSGANVLPIGALDIKQQGGTLAVCTRDGDWQFDVIDVFAEFLSRMVYKEFNLFPNQRYTPRITVDHMVVVRESWSFEPSQLSFVWEKNTAQRFLAARAWVQSHNIPRFIFIKVPGELKPCYIDCTSPISIEIFARLVRSNQGVVGDGKVIKVSEMLPEPAQSWLVDAEGQQYSSELRFVAVDRIKTL